MESGRINAGDGVLRLSFLRYPSQAHELKVKEDIQDYFDHWFPIKAERAWCLMIDHDTREE